MKYLFLVLFYTSILDAKDCGEHCIKNYILCRTQILKDFEGTSINYNEGRVRAQQCKTKWKSCSSTMRYKGYKP